MPTSRTNTNATQPGDVTPSGDDTTQAANQERAKDVNPDTTSQSPLTESQAHPDRTYHDSLSGRPVDQNGNFTDGLGEGPIPDHRIVSDSWAEDRQDQPTEADARPNR